MADHDGSIANTVQILEMYIQNSAGKKADISTCFQLLKIYENIFTFYLTGYILVSDSFDYQANLPIIGGERLSISFKYFNEDIILDFKVLRVSEPMTDTIANNNDKKNWMIHFVSDEAITNLKTTISKKFSGTTASIVPKILGDHLLSTKSFESAINAKEKQEFVSNFWTPSEAISFAINTSPDYPDLLFYETLNGFKLNRLYNLMDTESSETLVYTNNVKRLANNIVDSSKMTYFDLLMNFENGSMGNTTYYCPTETNEWKKVETNLNKIYSEDIVSLGYGISAKDEFLDNKSDIKLAHYNPTIYSKRNIIMNMMKNYNLKMKLPGNLLRTVGNVVEIEYKNILTENFVHDLYSGNWFITDVCHIIDSSKAYQHHINLYKNAFMSSDNVIETNGKVNL